MIAIGELARQTGCNVETIRYYERIGLTPKAERRRSYRTYALLDVERLRFIRRARELGFTIDAVRALLGISNAELISCGDARSIASRHLDDVRAKISDLQRMERVLASTVAACDRDHNDGCPVIAALSATG